MNFQQIRSLIIEFYDSRLTEMSPEKSLHWNVRMWRISGDQTRAQKVKEAYALWLSETPREYTKTKSRRILSRREFYKKNPDILNYLGLAHHSFMAKSLGQSDEIGIKKLGLFKPEEILRNKDFLYFHPSEIANLVYYLKFLGITDLESEVIDGFKAFWLPKKPANKMELYNKLYGFTHLVIASTYFYQKDINEKTHREKFRWILDYFEHQEAEILEKVNLDIAIEVALCFKFLGVESRLYDEIRKKVADKFSEDLGFLPVEKSVSFRRAEHRNILAVMLFTENLMFYEGPKI